MGAISADWNAIVTSVARKPKREFVDFSRVSPSHWSMHDRLENWAKASRGGDGQSGASTPMFVFYRSSDSRREYGAETEIPVDRSDAVLVAKGVGFLPEKHRRAIHWYYIHGGRDPVGLGRQIAVSKQGLADLVVDARQMLINRKV